MNDTSSWSWSPKGSWSPKRIGFVAAGAMVLASVGLLAQGAGACDGAGYTRGISLSAGVTKVALASTLVQTFRQDGLAVTTSGSLGATPDGLDLPVTGGLVWSESGWGSVNHGGQLIFEDQKDGRDARFSDVHLNFLPTPELTAKTSSGSEIELLNVHLTQQPAAGITFRSGSGSHRQLTYRDIRLDVSATGAAAIDGSLRTSAVKSGELVGQASVIGRGQVVN
jgi:hypothetical protein